MASRAAWRCGGSERLVGRYLWLAACAGKRLLDDAGICDTGSAIVVPWRRRGIVQSSQRTTRPQRNDFAAGCDSDGAFDVAIDDGTRGWGRGSVTHKTVDGGG